MIPTVVAVRPRKSLKTARGKAWKGVTTLKRTAALFRLLKAPDAHENGEYHVNFRTTSTDRGTSGESSGTVT
jgi:hypothetical protein